MFSASALLEDFEESGDGGNKGECATQSG